MTVSNAVEFDEVVRQLLAVLPAGVVVTDPNTLESYRWDRSFNTEAVSPFVVVRAESTEHVQIAVRVAAAAGVPVVPRGAGTSLSGGSSSPDASLMISLERMRDITIDPATRTATVQPGLFNAEVKTAAAQHGLWYPPDPSSFEICSIGGNIATNAGGLCCVKYGVTSDYVLGLTVVLADGQVVKLGGPRLKDVAGLSLTKLFVGSEGTLGIVTEVVLRLIPAQQAPSTLVAMFADIGSACAAVVDITRELRPAMLEFMDRVTINAIEDDLRMGLDRAAAGMLIVQSDVAGGSEIARIEQLCAQHGATECYATDDPAEGEAFTVARRAALPAIEKLGSWLLEDVGVPVPALGELVTGVEKIAEKHQVFVSVVAHAGDGNTHPIIVFDPNDADQKARSQLAYDEIMQLATSLGGTITGEHGVGRLKQPWLRDYLGEEGYELNLRIKQALDPQNLMNPGVMFKAK